jgi:hypothetical protein
VVFEYKHADSRKAAKALISTSVKDPKQALERMLDVEVLSVEIEQ